MTPALAEVDLDAAPEPAAPAPGRPVLAAAAVVAVLALVGAAAVRSALTSPPAPPRPAVTAWVALVAFTPGPDGGAPVADVTVTVANRGEEPLTVRGVQVTGRRVAPGSTDPGLLRVPAAQTVEVPVRVPLACTAGAPGRRDAGIDVRVGVAGGYSVLAVPLGALARADGACRAAQDDVPAGWARPLRVLDARFTAAAATIRLDGLPTGATVVGVYAAGTLLPVEQVARAPRPGRVGQVGSPDGPLTLVLGPPEATCRDGADRLPYGLELRLQVPGGLESWYADAGPALARWLLGARAADGADCRDVAPVVR